MGSDAPSDAGFISWTILALLQYAAMNLFLHKERSVVWTAVLGFAFYGLQTAGLLLLTDVRGTVGIAAALLFRAISCFRVFTILTGPEVSLTDLSRRLELCVMLVVPALLILELKDVPLFSTLPLLSATLLCLAGLIVLRTAGGESFRGGSRLRGSAFIFTTVLLLAVLIGAFLSFASLPLGELVTIAGTALLAAAKWAVLLLGRVLLFLFSLLPAPESGPVEAQNPGIPDIRGSDMEGEYLPDLTPLLFIGILAAVIAAALLYVFLFRRRRLGGWGRGSVRRGRLRRTRPSLFSGLWSSFLSSCRYHLCAIRYRNTPQGVYVWLLRRAKKAPGETPGGFLRRLAADMDEGDLLMLAGALDQTFYGGAAPGLPPDFDARLLRKEYRRWRRSALVGHGKPVSAAR
jgi:hypothetical protein